MTDKEFIEELKNDPEVMAGIREGLRAAHFGRVFSSKLVFASLEGTGKFPQRLFYEFIIRLMETWWKIKSPFQKFAHRNCPYCKSPVS